MSSFSIIDSSDFRPYTKQVAYLRGAYEKYHFNDLDLRFMINASAVYSSNIEGNTVDLHSFMNFHIGSKSGGKKTKEISEIEDLIATYDFAREHALNERNFLKTHAMLAKRFVIATHRGRYRKQSVGVFGSFGLVYLAVEPKKLSEEMSKFWKDISVLCKKKLSLEETFYFASQIHLKFAHLHPFMDGNGRAARLLEKWFLAVHLGNEVWKLASEQYYWDHRLAYYKNINLGVNYWELDYTKRMPFLKMLAGAVKAS